MVSTNFQRRALTALTVAFFFVAGCGHEKSGAPSSVAQGRLAGVCPAVVKIQTDWFPEAEHGGVYELLGDGFTINKETASVRGQLMDGSSPTGIDVEILAGGQLSGGRSVSATMYSDDSITMGYVNTDSAVRDSSDTPTIAVFAPLDKSPLGFMWDATKHPGAKTLAAALEEIDTVAVFGRLAFVEYLLAKGILPENKIDLNYKGDLQIATRDIIHQGFSTAEPYQYEQQHGIEVAFQSLYDLGWPIYPEALAVRADQFDALSPCLDLLVPVLQRAQVAFMKKPARAIGIIVDAVEEFGAWWQYDAGIGKFSVETQKSTGIVATVDSNFGALDPDRVQKIIDNAAPIFRNLGKQVPEDLAPSDLFDNQFIDPSIGNP